MTVTDKQVAALHAQLAGRGEEHKRLFAELDADEVGYGYSALVAAAVYEAIERRFVRDGKIADDSEVIDFVANLRSRTADVAEDLDPVIAERLIFHSLGKGEINDIDQKVFFGTQILVLAGLIADAGLSEAELDSFMNVARGIAEDWTSRDN
ncbi:hypothetical protein ACN3XK_24115 [Actinomadura welshii]